MLLIAMNDIPRSAQFHEVHQQETDAGGIVATVTESTLLYAPGG